MVRKSDERKTVIRHEMRGGKGDVEMIESFSADEIKSNVRVCSLIVINEGCSIGQHVHEGEDEIFYIIEGTGKVNDNGTDVIVTAGDSVLTGNGTSHGIENIGNTPLKLFAVVITY